jgi:hypothetical protein
MLRAFGIERALEELFDLVERERPPLLAGGHGIALDWFETIGRIDRDESFLDREVEDIAERREVLLLGDRGEQRSILDSRPFNGFIERTSAVNLGSVRRNARQRPSCAETGVVIDSVYRSAVANAAMQTLFARHLFHPRLCITNV